MNHAGNKARKFGTGIRPDAALLIVDMVNPFDYAGGAALARAGLVAARRILRLRERFDRAGAPVIYVNDNFMHWQADFRDLVASCLREGAPGEAIARLLQPLPEHYYILKPKHSAFHCTPLSVLLEKLEVGRLAVTGIATDSCILGTAQDADMLEYPLWIPGDCTAAQTTQRKRRALALMESSFDASLRPSTRAR